MTKKRKHSKNPALHEPRKPAPATPMPDADAPEPRLMGADEMRGFDDAGKPIVIKVPAADDAPAADAVDYPNHPDDPTPVGGSTEATATARAALQIADVSNKFGVGGSAHGIVIQTHVRLRAPMSIADARLLAAYLVQLTGGIQEFMPVLVAVQTRA